MTTEQKILEAVLPIAGKLGRAAGWVLAQGANVGTKLQSTGTDLTRGTLRGLGQAVEGVAHATAAYMAPALAAEPEFNHAAYMRGGLIIDLTLMLGATTATVMFARRRQHVAYVGTIATYAAVTAVLYTRHKQISKIYYNRDTNISTKSEIISKRTGDSVLEIHIDSSRSTANSARQ